MITVPVSATYIGLNALIFLYLSYKVVRMRQKAGVGFGDGGNADMQQAIRVHSNNFEYVPLALLILLALEIMGGWSLALNVLGAALTLARAAHAFGLGRSTDASAGRFFGTLFTWIVILVGSIWLVLMGVGVL